MLLLSVEENKCTEVFEYAFYKSLLLILKQFSYQSRGLFGTPYVLLNAGL